MLRNSSRNGSHNSGPAAKSSRRRSSQPMAEAGRKQSVTNAAKASSTQPLAKRKSGPKNLNSTDKNLAGSSAVVSPPPQISPANDFLIKQNPMQLYPKMPKVRVGDLQLGRKFSRQGKDDVQSYMERTERMVVAR